MTNREADFATWIERNPAPSVAELIKEYGSYGAIPKRAWRDPLRLTTRIGRNSARRVSAKAAVPETKAPSM